MKISKPRREILKQTIRGLIVSKPKINNLELASETGIHRNTVTKLLREISRENEVAVRERWKFLLNDTTEIAQARQVALERLWSDSYWSMSRSKPAQLVAVLKENWRIQKDLYRMHLEYIGIRENPKVLVQMNLSGKTQLH
jgi:predicted transcriptional regulator